MRRLWPESGHIWQHEGVCLGQTNAQAFELATLKPRNIAPSSLGEIAGWDGRIRTYGTLYQKQLPYHLATSQQRGGEYDEAGSGSSPK